MSDSHSLQFQFVQGCVVGGCLALARAGSERNTPKVLGQALQQGVALAAGAHTATAVTRGDTRGALLAITLGVAGVALLEQWLCAQTRTQGVLTHE